MQITLESMIKRSPHFDEKAWGVSGVDTKLSVEYEIVNHLEAVRQRHNDYLAKFGNMINEVN
jgi:hypothetical protein